MRLPAALAVALFVGAVACGGEAPPAVGGDITMRGHAFVPAEVTTTPGHLLTVVNRDRVTHDVASDGRGLFQVPALVGGTSGTVTAPTAPGRYPYTCTFHPDMHGVLVVR